MSCSTLAADVRYAVRVLGRTPSFTLAVDRACSRSASAPTTAIFSIVNTVLLRPLPFDEPDRLVRLFHVPPQATFPGMPTLLAVARELLRLAARGARPFEGMAMYRFRSFTLTGSGAPRSRSSPPPSAPASSTSSARQPAHGRRVPARRGRAGRAASS